MKIKATALLLLISTILTLALTACGKKEKLPKETTVPETTAEETEPPVKKVTIVGDDENDFIMIKPEKATDIEQECANTLFLSLKRTFVKNFDKKFGDDFVNGLESGAEYVSDAPEILIGATNRKESRELLATLGEDEYIIKLVGSKLVILGSADYATRGAVNRFIADFIENDEDDTLEIPEDLEIRGKKSLREVDINECASLRIMSWNLGCEVGLVNDCVKILNRYLPDIICLQEANKAIHQKVVAKLPENYVTSCEKHGGSSTYVYTPIIYNKNAFKLAEASAEWLDGRYTGTNTKSVAYAVFYDLKTGTKFGIINFHGAVCTASYTGYENMSNAERNAVAAAWRLDNVRQVIEIKDRLVKKHGDIPIMVTGDMNFNVDSEPYKKLTDKGFLDAEFTAREGKVTGYATYFNYGSGAVSSGKSIDHIMQINGVDFVEHMIVRDKEVLSASDHCPVYVDINIKK